MLLFLALVIMYSLEAKKAMNQFFQSNSASIQMQIQNPKKEDIMSNTSIMRINCNTFQMTIFKNSHLSPASL